ncbi:site-specific DNA-methyltransferase, partial [Patescibacteria group bacterium]|nr:site-specific DNA-methyltransferase [Patescibacteria group bacterium]
MPITKLTPENNYPYMQERLKALEQAVPEAFEDGKINWEKLREVLGENLEDEGREEFFGLNWPGKREARIRASTPSRATLAPAPGEGVNEDETENLFIEGDNLEVLKLLQKSFAGKIKMIYIDPPYNTGNDFIYNDNFTDPLEAYLEYTGAKGESGELLTTNTRSDGRFHSKWLNMMYPRLILARQLLSEDGVIFVSIDDNEVHNLRQMMNEIFGEENFIKEIVIYNNPRGRQSDRFVATSHEYLLAYSKSESECELFGIPLTEEQISEYKFTDENGKKYRYLGLRQRGSASLREDRPAMFYPIFVNPENKNISLSKSKEFSIEVLPQKSDGRYGRWMWGKQKVLENTSLIEGYPIRNGDRYDIRVRDYLKKHEGKIRESKPKSTWVDKQLNTQNGTTELKKILETNENLIEFPKPVFLIKKILNLIEDEVVILDFFSGSGTTAQAILELNKENGRNNRFILIQIPEKIGRKDYVNIAEIGKERIRRVIRNIEKIYHEKANETPLLINEQPQIDLGFKVFRYSRSNYKPWKSLEEENVESLTPLFENQTDPLISGWKKED